MVREGEPAPDFTLCSDAGEDVSLADLRGRTVVLYFYPRGRHARAARRRRAGCATSTVSSQERGATVLGVSPDTEASHVKFREKYGLPFPLLADPDHEVAEHYGVWVEKNMYGKKSMGIKRSTFVIDGDGNVARAMLGVKPDDHADEVLAALP